MGRLNQEVAEADDFLTVLVSRDTACIVYRLRGDDAGHAMSYLLAAREITRDTTRSKSDIEML